MKPALGHVTCGLGGAGGLRLAVVGAGWLAGWLCVLRGVGWLVVVGGAVRRAMSGAWHCVWMRFGLLFVGLFAC